MGTIAMRCKKRYNKLVNCLIFITLALTYLNFSVMNTKIQVPEHIREYVVGKFNDFQDGAVRFPDQTDVYHSIYDLLGKRPQNCPVDKGNLEIQLPARSIGKSPSVYNYLGLRSVCIIVKKLENMMWAELHDVLDHNKHRYGIEYIVGIHEFMNKYGIESLSEDAFLKNYYRWRAKIRRKEKRKYTKKNILSKCG